MTTSFDFATWVRRLHEFGAALDGRAGFDVAAWSITPALLPNEADAVARTLGIQLPAALRTFLTEAASETQCRFTFEYDPDDSARAEAFLTLFPFQTSIYGGPSIGPVDAFEQYARSCAEWGAQFRDAGDEHEAKRWGAALPIIAVANGDYVALDRGSNHEFAADPAVLYLSHEGESTRLSHSFTAFLATWETLAYLGPEIWLLDNFLAADGTLATASPAADRLRWLIGAPE